MPIEEKHRLFVERLRGLAGPWGMAEKGTPPTPDVGTSSLKRWLGPGITTPWLCYQYRHDGLADTASHDDWFNAVFNPRRVDLALTVKEAMPAYVVAFDAYCGMIMPEPLFDAGASENLAIHLDRRHAVNRVPPVCFFDRELCLRAFDTTPERVCERLQGRVEGVTLFHSGVYIIGSSAQLPTEEADALSWRMKEWILAGESK